MYTLEDIRIPDYCDYQHWFDFTKQISDMKEANKLGVKVEDLPKKMPSFNCAMTTAISNFVPEHWKVISTEEYKKEINQIVENKDKNKLTRKEKKKKK